MHTSIPTRLSMRTRPGQPTLGLASLTGALALTVATLSACAHSSAPSIATASQPAGTSASSHSATTAPSSTSTESDLQKYIDSMRAYAQCARNKGIDLPDPDAKGQINYSPGPDQPNLKTDPKIQTELTTCTKLILPAPDSVAYPPLTATQLHTQQLFSQCMRSHGVTQYPDPVTSTNPSSPDYEHHESVIQQLAPSPTYQTALNTCSNSVLGHAPKG